MQEYWIFFAIATAICIGFYGFAQKIKAEIPYQSDNGFVAYSYITMWIVWILGSLIFGTQLDLTNTDIFLYALWITLCYIVIVKTRLISLRYLSSSSYFINYRIASSLWLMFVGIIFFAETISLGEILWIFLWFVVFYLLIEKKSASESISDMKKWFLYLLIGSIAVTWVQAVAKDFTTSWLDLFTLIFFQWILGTIFMILLRWKEPLSKMFEIQNSHQWLFLLLSWLVFWIATPLNNYALIWWDLAIVYKIISYSLFIPIILSIIFYKEQVTGKKLLAFVLTILSIFLFI